MKPKPNEAKFPKFLNNLTFFSFFVLLNCYGDIQVQVSIGCQMAEIFEIWLSSILRTLRLKARKE